MRSAIRQDGAKALEDAHIRRSVLVAAKAEDMAMARGADWLDATLCRRMAALPRMQTRLFEWIAQAVGDPASCSDSLRRFLLLPSDARKEAALRAGLTYHLNAFGTAFAREIVAALSGVFGSEAVRFAFAHAVLSPASAAPLDPSQDESRRLVLADGGRILALWFKSEGLAGAWQPDWGDLDAGSVTLIRPAACAIGAAAAAATIAERDGADDRA